MNEILEVSLKKFDFFVGVDEVGRGAAAGPVVASAVIMPIDKIIEGVTDSKKLSPNLREQLFEKIIETAVSVGIGAVDNRIIDEINILNATKIAMKMAIEECLNGFSSFNRKSKGLILIDGNFTVKTAYNLPSLAVIKGDQKSYNIASASIVAKVFRDGILARYEGIYAGFSFKKHKGYLTKSHIQEIRSTGVLKIHRKSFLKKVLAH